MTAVGYTSGDPRKVDVAGDTMTGDLVLPADPDQPLEAATKQYVDNSGGGGGGTPSGTVVSETAFGQAATAGAAGTFSRGDHTHGTPAAPSVPSASGTVASETSFGVTSSAGAAGTFSRGDHTHGSPTAPTAGSVGADPAGTAATAVATHSADTTNVHGIVDTADVILESDPRLTNARTPTAHATSHGSGGSDPVTPAAIGAVPTTRTISTTAPVTGGGDLSANRTIGVDVGTGAGQVAAGNHTHAGGGGVARIDSGLITNGPFTMANGVLTALGPPISIAAVAGDRITLQLDFLVNTGGSDCYFDAATRVAAANVNWLSSRTGTRAGGGVPSWMVPAPPSAGTSYGNIPNGRDYVVQAGDLDGGNVTLQAYGIGDSGTRDVLASSSWPGLITLTNWGQ